MYKTIRDDEINIGKLSRKEIQVKADRLVKYAISSPFITDLTSFVVKNRHGITAPIAVFQTATLNHTAVVFYSGGKEAEKKFGKWGAVIVSLSSAFVLFSLADIWLTDESRKLKGSTYNEPFAKKIIYSLLGQL